jgi:hypothetical protein
VCAFACAAIVLGGEVRATTRDIADLGPAPLVTRQSVISELTSGVLQDPYDEFLRRPFDLSFVNIERHPNLSPWPGQEGEQARYVDFLIGNNGSTNVSHGSDTLQGTYLAQGGGKLAWGVSLAYLADDLQNSDSTATSSFSDGEELIGADLRFGAGYRITDRIVLGAGVTVFDRGDSVEDQSFAPGTGGFYSLQELTEQGAALDVGMRWFTSETTSWSGSVVLGLGGTELDDFSETFDAAGAVTSRVVITDYEVSDQYVELSGGYNRRYVDGQGEMQVRAGVRSSSHELDNSTLALVDDGVTVTPTLVLVGQDPVTETEVFGSAETLFLRGWTEIFGGARLAFSQTDGSTEVDSLGVIVEESIDDSRTSLALVMGLRQPLWNEKFRLLARARADWVDESQETSFTGASTGTDTTGTATSFAIGVETVLNNMVFDLAWLFGGDPAPGGTDEATRQTIDLDRLVISATFGW